jgi:SMODS domain-containing protein
MGVNDAFTTFQGVVNADIEQVREARGRRDIFKGAFGTERDVYEVIASGSLARGTQKDPIHDVDVVIVFDGDQHPNWGEPGASAEDALDETRQRVNSLLGATNGTYETAVRLARWRNHAVKCFLDDPEDPDAFTVDAMPALRRDGHLLIPEATSEKWVQADPEHLIAAVAAKHAAWNKFAGTVRMLIDP